MIIVVTVIVIVAAVLLIGFATATRIIKQYENGVLFRLGRVIGERKPGLRVIIPLVDVLHRVSLRIVTMPIQSQGIITRDNVSVDVFAVGQASDTMMARPLALQLRNLQSLVEIGVDRNTTVVFPAPLMSTIAELGSFLARENTAAAGSPVRPREPANGAHLARAGAPGPAADRRGDLS